MIPRIGGSPAPALLRCDGMTPSDRDDEECPGYVIGPGNGGADVQLGGTVGVTGVTHSDTEILSQVRARIAASSLAAHPLEIGVAGRVVTLAGRVPDEAAKHLAEQIAESVAGVKSVRSEIGVGRGADGRAA
jgi:hypothetical protein